jgi:hypothetical protein
MSEFRKQLQSLKAEYQSAKYPGNLVEELLGSDEVKRAWSPWRIGGYITAATGIAAAILISLLQTKPITQPSPVPPTAIATTQQQQPAVEALMPIAELSTETFPDDVPLVPSGDTLVPSSESADIGMMPSFPSIDFSSLSSIEEPA